MQGQRQELDRQPDQNEGPADGEQQPTTEPADQLSGDFVGGAVHAQRGHGEGHWDLPGNARNGPDGESKPASRSPDMRTHLRNVKATPR